MSILISEGKYAKSIHFLIIQGNNNNYEIITLISKGTTQKDKNIDVHIPFYDLEIYDEFLWETKIKKHESLSNESKDELISLLPDVQQQYRTILNFLNQSTL